MKRKAAAWCCVPPLAWKVLEADSAGSAVLKASLKPAGAGGFAEAIDLAEGAFFQAEDAVRARSCPVLRILCSCRSQT